MGGDIRCLKDFAIVTMGQSPAGQTCNTNGDGLPLLNGPTEFGHHNPHPVQWTNDAKRIAEPGDLLFCVRGSTTGRMNWADQKYAIGRGIAAISPRVSGTAYFIRAAIETQLPTLLASATGSTFPNINRTLLESTKVSDIDLSKQLYISAFLQSIATKSLTNHHLNTLLEQTAQAIFHSWFVTFDPVRAKMRALEVGADSEKAAMGALSGKLRLPADIAELEHEDFVAAEEKLAELSPEQQQELAETAGLFPSAMVESELGLVPEGWGISELKEVFQINPRRSLKKGAEAPYLDMKNMPTSGHVVDEIRVREFSSGTKFIRGDTLLARITPCLENGKTAFVDFLSEGETAWGSTEYIVLRSIAPLPLAFSYFLSRNASFRAFAIQNMVGTSGRQRVNIEALSTYKIAVPDSKLIGDRFGKLADLLMTGISERSKSSGILRDLRDTLLPKLISGELSVEGLEEVE